MGTPRFAVPSLERIVEAGHGVAAVFTQPDRPSGRERQVHLSPVKEAARRLSLDVYQPDRIRRPETVEQLASYRSDVMVVVGYGQLIPQSIIDLPRYGIVNVHASLLPKYRGAAPIQWAIANGETTTGVTTMLINAGLDTGNLLLQSETGIGANETASELSDRLAQAGAGLLADTLSGLEAGSVQRRPQPDHEATLAPILKKEDGLVDWSMSASQVYNRWRGFLPWPGIYSIFRGQLIHLWKTKPAYDRGLGSYGSLHAIGRRLLVTCGQDTTLELEEVQLEGRKRVTADAFRNGQRLTSEDILGERTN